MNQTLIGPITQLISMHDLPINGKLKDQDVPILKNAGILIQNDRIKQIGSYTTLLKKTEHLDIDHLQLKDHYVCTPGFIDAHTHICFGGSRANDYAMRNSGKSYLEIANSGGGIWDTVQQTRNSTQEELMNGIIKRANQMLQRGITSIEVKSGYGLSVTEELKMLRAIKKANHQTEADLVGTCLAAHIFPKDFEGTIEQYLQNIMQNLFPLLKKESLSHRIDAFIEESAFKIDEIKPYLTKAAQMGFDITLHADQFTTSGSQLAVEINAISADHLEASTDTEINLLAKSNVIPVALPGASIGLGCAFTPARKLLDAGASLAIASDWNPGSAPMGDLLTQACILGTFEKLSNSEVLAGITYRAAAALGFKYRGTLAPKMMADFNLFQIDHFNEIFYQQGQLKPSQVWKKGKCVYNSAKAYAI